MRTVEFKMERPGLVSAGDKVKIIEREGTSSYSYIIDPAVAMSGCFAARDRIKSEYGIVKDVRENSRGFYVVGDFDEDDVHSIFSKLASGAFYDNGTILISSAVVSAAVVAGAIGAVATVVSSTRFPGASVPITTSVGFTDGCTFPVSTGDTELCVGVTGTIFSAVVVVVSSTLVPVSSSLISSTVSTLVFAETSRETGKLQSTLEIPPFLLQLQSCQ